MNAGRIGFFGLLLLLGGGVAAGGQRGQDRLLAEIRQIQSQLAELTEAQTKLGDAVQTMLDGRDAELAEARRNRADDRDAVERMERDISTLTAALAEMNERFSTLMAEVASVREAQRTAALAGAPIGGESGPGEAGDAAETGEGEETASGEVEVLDGPTITEIYMQAQSDYLQGRYELAIGGFETVVEGGSELADDARYFIGDALLAQDRLEPALDQFEIVIRDFPDSQRIGDAWFKRGVILRRLGHESDAREIFEDILDVFAGTSAALAAQRELESMGPRDPG